MLVPGSALGGIDGNLFGCFGKGAMEGLPDHGASLYMRLAIIIPGIIMLGGFANFGIQRYNKQKGLKIAPQPPQMTPDGTSEVVKEPTKAEEAERAQAILALKEQYRQWLQNDQKIYGFTSKHAGTKYVIITCFLCLALAILFSFVGAIGYDDITINKGLENELDLSKAAGELWGQANFYLPVLGLYTVGALGAMGGLKQHKMYNNKNATGIIPVVVNAQTDAKDESTILTINEHPELDDVIPLPEHIKDIPSQGKTRTIYYPNAHVPVKAKDEASSAQALSPTQEVMKLGAEVCDANNESAVVETSPYFMKLGFCRCATGKLDAKGKCTLGSKCPIGNFRRRRLLPTMEELLQH